MLIAVCIVLTLAGGCSRNKKALLPNISGKAGEVVVVIDRDSWEGNLGSETRSVLASDCPYLAQREPMFNVTNVPPASFTSLFKVHRNIVLMNVNPQVQETGVVYKHDEWARPQAIVQINAHDADEAIVVLRDNSASILEFLEQAERDRIIANSILYEEKGLRLPVEAVSGGRLHLPSGYKLRKQTDDFVWIADDKQYTNQYILVFKYPVSGRQPFESKTLLDNINSMLQANVPGMVDNSYMVTSDAMPVTFTNLTYRQRQFVQVRGFWEVYNDYMGGPFVAHAFYSKDGKDIIVLYAFVYAPRYDKRLYFRQVESMLYSFEWVK